MIPRRGVIPKPEDTQLEDADTHPCAWACIGYQCAEDETEERLLLAVDAEFGRVSPKSSQILPSFCAQDTILTNFY